MNVNELSSCKSAELALKAQGTGKNQLLDELNRFDLVQLVDSRLCGVILKFNNHTVTMVTNKNEVQMMEVGMISHKIITARHSGMDCRNNAVVVNDKVRIMTGPLKNLTAAVMHIKQNHAFVRIMEKID